MEINSESGIVAKRISTFLKILILSMWTIIMLGLFSTSIVQTVCISEVIRFEDDSICTNMTWIVLVYIVLVFSVLLVKKYSSYKLHKYFKEKKTYIVIAVTAAMACFLIWWIFVTQYEPSDDQAMCMEIAAELLQGNKDSWISGYMSMYPFQNGLVFFDMLLLSVFGAKYAYLAFQYINLVFFVIAVLAVNSTCCRMLKKENSIFVWAALVLFYPFAVYTVYCYGVMIGLALAALAVMFLFTYFEKRKMYYLVLSAISIVASITIKPNYAIVLIGIILYLLYDIIVSSKTKHKVIWGIIIFVTIYMAGSKSINFAFDSITGYSNEGIPKIAWVAMGTHDLRRYSGRVDSYHEWVYEYNKRDKEKTIHDCIKNIRSRLTYLANEKRLSEFYYKKITSEWNDPTWECFYIQEKMMNASDNPYGKLMFSEKNNVYRDILNILQMLSYFGVLMYIFIKWGDLKNLSVYELFNAVLMLGAFIFWAVWEARAEYILPYYYMIIPYSVIGWKKVVVKGVNRIEKRTMSYPQQESKRSEAIAVMSIATAVIIVASFVRTAPVRTSGDQKVKKEYVQNTGESAENISDIQEAGIQPVPIGSIITFGKYEQDNDEGNGAEPIEWLVIDDDDGKILVVSRYAIDCALYNETMGAVTWEYSNLRNFVNTEFYNKAFSETEKSAILATEISNSDNIRYKTNGGNATIDRVFCLSMDEADKYFVSNQERRADPTEYVIEKGAEIYGSREWYLSQYCWWTRSPGEYQNYVVNIYGNGYINDTGITADSNGPNAVRPALWIKTK